MITYDKPELALHIIGGDSKIYYKTFDMQDEDKTQEKEKSKFSLKKNQQRDDLNQILHLSVIFMYVVSKCITFYCTVVFLYGVMS